MNFVLTNFHDFHYQMIVLTKKRLQKIIRPEIEIILGKFVKTYRDFISVKTNIRSSEMR
jgi:hypothetical protein